MGLVLLLTGCGDRGGRSGAAADTLNTDTAGRALQGLSPAEIQQSARPMTQEQAAQMGIIDTTIHVEDLSPTEANTRPPSDTTR
jgi:hypothetical protein